jgi:adenylyl-sulfate kinase
MNLVKKGFVLWFTGLSGAGKSTLSARLAAHLARAGCPVELLDGDEVRTHLSRGLSFSREDRDINVRRIGFVARLLARHGVVAITAAISPYRDVREEQRRLTAGDGAEFCEVYMECPIEVLADRDVKGLYRKALAGEIPHFTGVSDPYEPPEHPDVVIRSDRDSVEEGLDRVLARLVELELLAPEVREVSESHGGDS